MSSKKRFRISRFEAILFGAICIVVGILAYGFVTSQQSFAATLAHVEEVYTEYNNCLGSGENQCIDTYVSPHTGASALEEGTFQNPVYCSDSMQKATISYSDVIRHEEKNMVMVMVESAGVETMANVMVDPSTGKIDEIACEAEHYHH